MTTTTSIVNAPAIPSLRFRALEAERDFQALADLISVSSVADRTEEAVAAESLKNRLQHLNNFDLSTDLLLAQVGEQLVAQAMLSWGVYEGDLRVFSVDGCVHPDWRGRGLGRALLSWQEARAHQIAVAVPAGSTSCLQTYVPDTAQAKVRLFEHAGYLPVRYAFVMVRPNLDDVPDLPLPEGLEVRPVRPEDLRTLWNAKVEAFQDHWGHRPSTEEDYLRTMNDPALTPQLWQVAWDTQTNEVAGMVVNYIFKEENERYHLKRGWTDPICVRRPYRRRGLARALIMRSLKVLRVQGMTEAALGVDAENANKALHLYESCGYQPVQKTTFVRKMM
jgi:GNAT superfamily N-acetyltransferase